jgi:Caspase domain
MPKQWGAVAKDDGYATAITSSSVNCRVVWDRACFPWRSRELTPCYGKCSPYGQNIRNLPNASGSERHAANVNTIVVYAARDGQVTLDGDGANSPFATALLGEIRKSGIEINKLFRLVHEMTGNRQEPYTYGALFGRDGFFFAR